MYVPHEIATVAEIEYRREQLMALRRPRRPRRSHRPRRTSRNRVAPPVASVDGAGLG
jgi:hypothetical protein